MPIEQEEQNMNKIENKTKDLSQVDLIHPGTACFYDIPANNLLLIRDKILNPRNHIKIKYPGLRVKAPGLQDSYIVDTSRYNVIVKNPETADGRYSQDIGAGDDITLTMKITFKVDQKPGSLKRLMEQQKSYKDAIRATSEAIMRLLIDQHYLSNSHETKLNEYQNLKKEVFNIVEMMENFNGNSDKITEQIIKEATNLHKNYGILISKIDFTDIDYSDRIKQIIVKNIEKENERKIARQQSELEKEIASNEAEAIKTRLTTEIQALKENGFTNEQIALYYNMKNLPQNAIAVLGQNKGSMITDFMTASMALNGTNQSNTVVNENINDNEHGRGTK